MGTITKQIIATCLILVCTILLYEFSNIDIAVQDAFYNFETQQWLVDRDEKISKFILYDGIKKAFIIFVITRLAGHALFRKTTLIREYRQGLWIVTLSCILVPILIGGLKASTNTPCPKNISHYGGDYPYVTVLEKYPADFQQPRKIQCYPAGHASGGFALLSLFFLFRSRKNRIIAATTAMFIGWSIGMYKMLIGDHFLSHTMVTMLLAWLIILIIVQITQATIRAKRQ